MEDIKITRIAQKKDGKTWINTFEESNESEVYKSLTRDLINKKINKCSYITSIRRENIRGFYSKIIVTYDNNVRSVYTVKEW